MAGMRRLDKYNDFEKNNLQETPVDFQRNLCIVDGLYELAKQMGHFQKPCLDKLERKIALFQRLHKSNVL